MEQVIKPGDKVMYKHQDIDEEIPATVTRVKRVSYGDLSVTKYLVRDNRTGYLFGAESNQLQSIENGTAVATPAP